MFSAKVAEILDVEPKDMDSQLYTLCFASSFSKFSEELTEFTLRNHNDCCLSFLLLDTILSPVYTAHFSHWEHAWKV
jgi:hypothetical protein